MHVCVCVCVVCFDYCMSIAPSLIMPLFISCSQLRELLQSHPDDEELLQVGSAPLAGVSYVTVMVLQRKGTLYQCSSLRASANVVMMSKIIKKSV